MFPKQVECWIPINGTGNVMVKETPYEPAGHWLLSGAIALSSSLAAGQAKPNSEQRTSRYLESIRQQPSLVLAFLREMPKGGDLHNHLGGALYAENLIDYAVEDGLCVDRTTSMLIAQPCDDSCEKYTSKPAIRCAYQDHVLYNSIVDAWSMRNWSRPTNPATITSSPPSTSSRWPLMAIQRMVWLKQSRALLRTIFNMWNSCTPLTEG